MKEPKVQDPDRDGSPSGGASADLLPADAGTVPVVAASFGPGAGANQEARNAPDDRPRTKKRRKRRRGRKVFARDGSATTPSVAIDVPIAAASESPRTAPTAPAIQHNRIDLQLVAPRRNTGRAQPDEQPVFAALDLGTNNCRLLVAVPTRPGQFRVVDAFSRIVRLGEGLSLSGRLGQPAMDRAVEALKVCGDKLRNRKIRKARLIATEACRTAENGVEFLDRVEREAGLKLEIIDRQTEARLAVSGCGSLVERDTQGVVLFDIGGGSSEIALIDVSGQRSPRLASHIVAWTSLPVGVVSLAERFGGREVTRASFDAMVADVAGMLQKFDGRDRLARFVAGSRFHLLGTSGTVTTLAGVHLGLERYDRRRVDGLWMDNANVDAMVEKLLSWDFQARVANACIGADRADLVLGGCAILEAIRAVWPSERLRVADRGLREGMLSELMGEEGVWRYGWRAGARR
jgi:exopolyphosphatase/guanosine-5'-triphosphate,3'-diphosphate pyrophosphatase